MQMQHICAKARAIITLFWVGSHPLTEQAGEVLSFFLTYSCRARHHKVYALIIWIRICPRACMTNP